MLIAAGAIEPDQLEAALEEQKKSGGLLGIALVRMGFVDERTLVRVLAGQLDVPVIQLQGKQVIPEVLSLVPVEIVEKHRCLPLLVNGEGDARVLYLGMEDPSDPDVVAEICTLVGMNVQAVLVAPAELDDGIFRHYECDGFGADLLPEPPVPTGQSEPPGSTPALSSTTKAIDPNTADMEPSCPDDFGPEPSFVGLDALYSDDPDRPLEFVDSPALPTEACTRSAAGASASSDVMLRAIAQLLVEKGVFTRDELVEQLQALSETSDGA